jgi:hypothetical protein
LKAALEELGFGPCHPMMDLLLHGKQRQDFRSDANAVAALNDGRQA